MNPIAFRATLLNILANTTLFALKFIAGLVSGSIALLSDALNSLTDVASSIAIYVSVKISEKQADEGHPFGHGRAEPIAGLIVAILAGILSFEVIRASFEKLITKEPVIVTSFTLLVPVMTMATKGLMSWHFNKVARDVGSPALKATSIDSFSDVLVAFTALAGIAGASIGHPYLDPAAGLIISVWIMYTGYTIGVENIDYLMGRSPEPELMERIKEAALRVAGVKNINTVRAHYVGNFIHVEIHIEVDKNLPTLESHAIGKGVEAEVEKLGAIEKAFIHIDPV